MPIKEIAAGKGWRVTEEGGEGIPARYCLVTKAGAETLVTLIQNVETVYAHHEATTALKKHLMAPRWAVKIFTREGVRWWKDGFYKDGFYVVKEQRFLFAHRARAMAKLWDVRSGGLEAKLVRTKV